MKNLLEAGGGRSLISKDKVTPFVMRYSSDTFQMISGNYICNFDEKKAVGFYVSEDEDLKHNLIGNRNTEMSLLETRAKLSYKIIWNE